MIYFTFVPSLIGAVPLDRNAKARILAYARAWGAQHRQPGQHKGPITRAFLDVLEALLWGFHNARSGVCFPSYEAIAATPVKRSAAKSSPRAAALGGVLCICIGSHNDASVSFPLRVTR